MEHIFSQIHRFNNNISFEAGKPFTITLSPVNTNIKPITTSPENGLVARSTGSLQVGGTYCITVKPYMTEKASPTFDFMAKWNNDIPMPLVTMTGEVEKETRGMVYMNLHGEAKSTHHCMACGRPLTNPISQLYGLGPECGGHFYINPFNTKEEYEEAVQEVRNKMINIKWSGWVIKSAIKSWEEA